MSPSVSHFCNRLESALQMNDLSTIDKYLPSHLQSGFAESLKNMVV